MWSPQQQAGDTKIVGPAYTVRYVRKDDQAAPRFEGHYVRTPFEDQRLR
jgi:regulator of RNase E activity RraA